MRNSRPAIVFAVAAFGFVTSAFATCDRYCQDPDITTTVQALPDGVTLSTPNQQTFAQYRVTIKHYSVRDELLKPVKFTATTAVLDGSNNPVPGQTAEFVGLPAACTAATSKTINCTFPDGIYYKNADITFDVTVKVPSVGATVKVTSQTSWQEPNEYGNPTEYEPQRTASTSLTAPDPSKVTSFVPAGGGTLYTGTGGCDAANGCPATPSDTWTTTVKVPSSATAAVTELVSPVTCAPDLLTCSTSTLSIPGTFANLVIILRRDASTIGKHAKISSARIYYDNPTTPAPGVTYPLEVPSCTDTTYGVLPKTGIPCIDVRTEYPKKSVPPKPPVPPGFENDWEFVIKAVDNGRYAN